MIFASPHCPFVQHIKHELIRLERDYASQGLGILGISANDPVTYPDDAPEKVKQFATELGLTKLSELGTQLESRSRYLIDCYCPQSLAQRTLYELP